MSDQPAQTYVYPKVIDGRDEPTQLDRIEIMLIRLTHHITVSRGYSGDYEVSCSCGWKGKGWHWSGDGSWDSRIGPEVEFEIHLQCLMPIQ